ncbi:hypothetical protein R3I94_013100 [Phoxinus phoxinus]
MELYDKEINRNLMITAKNGAQMKAMTVFSESLRYLKDHALKRIEQNAAEKTFIATEVTWVLTVPAIWHAAAKQFMREAAIEAGLVTESEPERLIFALEPEAASVFCMHLPKDGFIAEEFSTDELKQSPGTQYMVVDCGGGTIDITVHEVVEEGILKELHAASGNDMGGQKVDGNIISFLKDIFSEEIFDRFEQEHPSELLKLKFDIANLKSFDSDVVIWCPLNLKELASEKQNMESYFEGVRGAKWEDGTIMIEEQQLRRFFENSLRAIETSIKQIVKNTELSIEYMLLVGGYSQSPTLLKFMQKHFGSRHKIICPDAPQVAILKGAIMYGKKPSVVKSRISTLTYGFSVCNTFDERIHKGKSKIVNSLGEEYCNVVFSKLVGKGESVLCDEPRKFTHVPVEPDQEAMRYRFYSTERQDVIFVDEYQVDLIGSLSVGMGNANKGMSREVRLEVKFGSTEMKATATDKESAETKSVKLDFMSK